MLVLSRKTNESIQIGDNIEITILSVAGDQVKIGIRAPKNIEIHRKEVFLSIQNENNQATHASISLLKDLNNSLKKN